MWDRYVEIVRLCRLYADAVGLVVGLSAVFVYGLIKAGILAYRFARKRPRERLCRVRSIPRSDTSLPSFAIARG